MKSTVRKFESAAEFFFSERCWIFESWNDDIDPAVSIARARVEPGVTTKAHRLEGIIERYLIVRGSGIVDVEGLEQTRVAPGDVVVIPAGASQRIQNDGSEDLIFYCVCTPRFSPKAYEDLEP